MPNRDADAKRVPKVVLPDNPAYKSMSKTQVMEAERLRKEKEAKLQAYAEELKIPTETKTETPAVEKPRGRPKKVE